jgi:uncharacterized protein YggT (Ycf19 family)
MLSNQSPAPTAPPSELLQPTAPIRPQALTYQPVEPIQPALQAPLQRSSGVWVAERAVMITYLVLSLVEALLITRVILKLLAANPEAAFVRFIYTVSAPLVAPFQGIFPTPATQSSVLELSSLVAIAVYALIGWGIARAITVFGQRESLS